MNPDDSPGAGGVSDPDAASTGLPWPRTWRGVYLFALGSFGFWLGVLIVLTMMYS